MILIVIRLNTWNTEAVLTGTTAVLPFLYKKSPCFQKNHPRTGFFLRRTDPVLLNTDSVLPNTDLVLPRTVLVLLNTDLVLPNTDLVLLNTVSVLLWFFCNQRWKVILLTYEKKQCGLFFQQSTLLFQQSGLLEKVSYLFFLKSWLLRN